MTSAPNLDLILTILVTSMNEKLLKKQGPIKSLLNFYSGIISLIYNQMEYSIQIDLQDAKVIFFVSY
ncbi:MAG: hypothetical protein A2Z29_09590 [Chloroflexi bacterium RBG_16_56_11]|nr:MAG: hypothetical protein A2Z29_09590 [Chloroflexi bacterium RBG_16_56_11]